MQRLELPAALLDPAPGQLGQQRTLEPLQRRPRRPGRSLGVARAERRLRRGRRRARLLHVERDAGQREPQAAAALDRLGPERTPHAREQRGEPGIGRARRAVVPDDVDQLVPAYLALAVERQAREQQPPLAARQVSLDPAPVDLDGEGAQELDTSGHGLPPSVTGGRPAAQPRAHDTPNTRAAASSRSSAAR